MSPDVCATRLSRRIGDSANCTYHHGNSHSYKLRDIHHAMSNNSNIWHSCRLSNGQRTSWTMRTWAKNHLKVSLHPSLLPAPLTSPSEHDFQHEISLFVVEHGYGLCLHVCWLCRLSNSTDLSLRYIMQSIELPLRYIIQPLCLGRCLYQIF